MRKNLEHVADNRGWTGGLVVVDRSGFVAVVWIAQEHSGSDTLEGVTVVVVERMFQRNADIRVASPASEAVLGCTWDALEQGGGVGAEMYSSFVAGMPWW